MDIPQKICVIHGADALFELIMALPVKIVSLIPDNILGRVIPTVFKESFKLGSKYTAQSLYEDLRNGCLN